MSALLRVENLEVDFNTPEGRITAVDGVGFSLQAGQILGLVGESGSGKSVAAKSLMRLNPGNAIYGHQSRMLLRGETQEIDILALKSRSELRQIRGDKISMVFQEPMASFAPAITIGHQMVEQLMLHRGTGRAEAKRISIEALERVGLSEPAARFDQYAADLSGGMRQRAMIAMALSTRPQLLIADEPTTALDVTIQAQILELILDQVAATGMGVIFITHDLGVIAEVADQVAVMYLGRLMEYGTVEDVILHPKHPYTRGLIAALPHFDDLQAPLTPVPGDIPSPLERPSGCVFHNRCPFMAKGVCDRHVPELESVGDGHSVACSRLSEVSA